MCRSCRGKFELNQITEWFYRSFCHFEHMSALWNRPRRLFGRIKDFWIIYISRDENNSKRSYQM